MTFPEFCKAVNFWLLFFWKFQDEKVRKETFFNHLILFKSLKAFTLLVLRFLTCLFPTNACMCTVFFCFRKNNLENVPIWKQKWINKEHQSNRPLSKKTRVRFPQRQMIQVLDKASCSECFVPLAKINVSCFFYALGKYMIGSGIVF